ncbi:hypothetical protein LCGC14_0251520 [marine sediment metagenome]|uniref:Uncharacterized protein n=1 Tax=marine sediment metagenome TaxID=412755 RepID=A0A0F9U4B3_9ZZZZ
MRRVAALLKDKNNGRHALKVTVQGVIGAVVLVGIIGGGFLAFGFELDTPADHIEEFDVHVDSFDDHVDNFEGFQEVYIENEEEKEESRDRRTQMVEAQAKLTCLRTGVDTLVMLDMIDVCDELGVLRP